MQVLNFIENFAKPYAKYFNGILEVSLGSFCLSSTCSISWISKFIRNFKKSFTINISVFLIIGTSLTSIFLGKLFIVFKFSNISSPVFPSPLDDLLLNSFSQLKLLIFRQFLIHKKVVTFFFKLKKLLIFSKIFHIT